MDYPSNRHTAPNAPAPRTEEPQKAERIVSGTVTQRKKPMHRRFFENFVGGGDARGVGEYLMFDVLLPAMKDTVADVFTQGIERSLFGEVRSTSRRSGGRPGGTNGYVSYNRYSAPTSRYASAPAREERPFSRTARAAHDFDEIIIPSRIEANEVLDALFQRIQKYEVATVADLYEMVNITPKFTDEKYGWTDMSRSGVTRVRNGFLLDLPEPEPLDR